MIINAEALGGENVSHDAVKKVSFPYPVVLCWLHNPMLHLFLLFLHAVLILS